jgi:hypothetical protein
VIMCQFAIRPREPKFPATLFYQQHAHPYMIRNKSDSSKVHMTRSVTSMNIDNADAGEWGSSIFIDSSGHLIFTLKTRRRVYWGETVECMAYLLFLTILSFILFWNLFDKLSRIRERLTANIVIKLTLFSLFLKICMYFKTLNNVSKGYSGHCLFAII